MQRRLPRTAFAVDSLVTSKEVTLELRPVRQERPGTAFQGEVQEIHGSRQDKGKKPVWLEAKAKVRGGEHDRAQGQGPARCGGTLFILDFKLYSKSSDKISEGFKQGA